ncbi:hypothetical protein O6H91_19G024800 [Diphasiastrum complanatum]|uniref:Uncharacterized protein n=2 Tax=Diphasiastrum complanatum TaxID=34168 RepID=A0ACC2ATK0_DIPCM|nr:hypothetical protein O6H91_19G024800 [Diphasiastrum complanatum]
MAEEGEKVILHVYDLSQGLARQLSASFLGKAIEGIWHTGIVVFGHEYYFGGGIQKNPVGLTPYGKPLRVVEMGFTQIPQTVFEDYLHEISPRYTAETYSLLRHNCNNFSDELSQFLVGVSIPEYILRLPEEVSNSPMGALIMPMIQQLETTLKYGGVPQVPQYTPGGPGLAGDRQQSPVVSATGNTRKEESHVASIEPHEILINGSIPPAVTPTILSSPKHSSSNHQGDARLMSKISSSKGVTSAVTAKDPLGEARTKVQEDITREFSILMASGSLSASEAAALATRRVMAKHGLGVGLRSPS